MEAQASILVVDDSPENLQVMAAVLKEQYKVRVAINGERALALATAPEPPDLILLDVMMPGMDGYEVCSRLKSNPATAGIPVLFVSSCDEEEDEARGLSVGAIDYIIKPIRPSIVQARVRNHIALKRSRDLLQRLTTQDHLTGISNRRRFDDYLEMEWRRAAREHAPISLISMDIDHFKSPGRRPVPDPGGAHAGQLHHAPHRSGGTLRWRGVCLRAAQHRQCRCQQPGRDDAQGRAGACTGTRRLGHAQPCDH